MPVAAEDKGIYVYEFPVLLAKWKNFRDFIFVSLDYALLPKLGYHLTERICFWKDILSLKSWLILRREGKKNMAELFPLKAYSFTLATLYLGNHISYCKI